ncbi:MAG: hypothetical protein HND59_05875 [Pseudomonadota bacterium]|nr:MAG: hypothetical protein HND59_05875 [Pseudomonadota bacterium]
MRLTALKGPRSSYPLKQLSAWTLTAERTALIGNAAHTVHPIGAQGFNLGLRDAATWQKALPTLYAPEWISVTLRCSPPTPGAAWPIIDGCSYSPTGLRACWTSAHPPEKLVRLGLELLQRLPPLRSALVHIGTGGLDAPTRLGRGLPL